MFTLLLFFIVVYFNIREPVYLLFALFLASSASVFFCVSTAHAVFVLQPHQDGVGIPSSLSWARRFFCRSVHHCFASHLFDQSAALSSLAGIERDELA